jgi:transposase
MDLRERVARAKGSGSSYEVAERFDVESSWVRKIWIRLAKTGSVAPLPRGGNRGRKVDPQGEQLIRAWIAETADMTIVEVMARYLAEREVSVSEPAMRRTLRRMGFSRKKRRSSQPSGRAKGSSSRATSTLDDDSDGRGVGSSSSTKAASTSR